MKSRASALYFTSFPKLYKGLIFENKLLGSMIDNIFNIFCKGNYKLFIRGLFTLFPNLITKESYNWWVTRRVWGFRHQISQNVSGKYLEASGEHRDIVQKNISKCRSDILGSFRRIPRHCAKWLRNSPDKRYQRIRICPTREVETPPLPSGVRRRM